MVGRQAGGRAGGRGQSWSPETTSPPSRRRLQRTAQGTTSLSSPRQQRLGGCGQWGDTALPTLGGAISQPVRLPGVGPHLGSHT